MPNPLEVLRALLLLCCLGAALTGCATLTPAAPPAVPCRTWQAAEAAWAATELYVRQQLAAQRGAACLPPAPPPTQPGPAEVPPPNATRALEQAPLPGRCRRE